MSENDFIIVDEEETKEEDKRQDTGREEKKEATTSTPSQTGECDREDDRSSEPYYGVSGLYAEKL